MSKMRLDVEGSGHVTISYDDGITGDRVERRFSAGGDRETYIIEHLSGGRTSQVCDRLAGTGNTLRARRDTLPAVIRHEYRAMRSQERRILGSF